MAPIPSASVTTATAVKPGFLANIRRPKRRSWSKVLLNAVLSGQWPVVGFQNFAFSSQPSAISR